MRSLQTHPCPTLPHTLLRAHQRAVKTPRGRTVTPTRPDPAVAAQCWRRSGNALERADGPARPPMVGVRQSVGRLFVGAAGVHAFVVM